MISFIVPAHNEQACLGQTLPAIHESARVVDQPYEIIVVDDASTDATAAVARHHNATVLPVKHRQIAATRNSGARTARGERLFFVDADTTINPRAVAAGLRWMDKGAVGGGAPTWIGKDEIVPLYGRLIALLCVIFAKVTGFTGGAFMFCTREAFHATGGFNERLYWAEEGGFALALKREGRFVCWGSACSLPGVVCVPHQDCDYWPSVRERFFHLSKRSPAARPWKRSGMTQTAQTTTKYPNRWRFRFPTPSRC